MRQCFLFILKVSAFSTWEKELHKIVFDPRYLLLNPKERKQVKGNKIVRTYLNEIWCFKCLNKLPDWLSLQSFCTALMCQSHSTYCLSYHLSFFQQYFTTHFGILVLRSVWNLSQFRNKVIFATFIWTYCPCASYLMKLCLHLSICANDANLE